MAFMLACLMDGYVTRLAKEGGGVGSLYDGCLDKAVTAWSNTGGVFTVVCVLHVYSLSASCLTIDWLAYYVIVLIHISSDSTLNPYCQDMNFRIPLKK